MSLTRMTIDELRRWATGPHDVTVPEDIWTQIDAGGEIEFGDGLTYDVASGLLLEVSGVARAELEPIELDDWIELVDGYNTDPIRPR